MFISLEKIKKYLGIEDCYYKTLVEKLNHLGLETNLFKGQIKNYLEITPLTNRQDLSS